MSACTACGRAGVPYEYMGRQFDGLTADRGERLCSSCVDGLDPLDVNVRFTNPANGDTDVRSLADMRGYVQIGKGRFHG